MHISLNSSVKFSLHPKWVSSLLWNLPEIRIKKTIVILSFVKLFRSGSVIYEITSFPRQIFHITPKPSGPVWEFSSQVILELSGLEPSNLYGVNRKSYFTDTGIP